MAVLRTRHEGEHLGFLAHAQSIARPVSRPTPAVVDVRMARPPLDRSGRHTDHSDRPPGGVPRLAGLHEARPRSRLALLVGVDVLVLHHRLEFFLSTSSAAASASAFSLRASSRSRARIRFVVARPARLSPSASRHCSYSACSTPSRCRRSVNLAPVSALPVARIRIFSSIDQSRLGRFTGMTGRLLASCIHRERVCCVRPVSNASCRALTPSLPVKRSTIFCLKARENGFVTEHCLLAPLITASTPGYTSTRLPATVNRSRSIVSCEDGRRAWLTLP